MDKKIEKLQENIVPAKDQTVQGFYSHDEEKTGKKILLSAIFLLEPKHTEHSITRATLE